MSHRFLVLAALLMGLACDPPAKLAPEPAAEPAAETAQDLQKRHGKLFKEAAHVLQAAAKKGWDQAGADGALQRDPLGP